MRAFIALVTSLLVGAAVPANGELEQAAKAKPAEATAAPAPKARWSTTDTRLTILDDLAGKAIVENHVSGLTTKERNGMARAMPLKDIQPYSPDATDDKLTAIDVEFAKL